MSVTTMATIFEVCIIPLLGILTSYLVKYIRAKSKNLTESTNNELANKYINMLTETIITCVTATNQTYVDSLKKNNSFDLAAQKQAFILTKSAIMDTLSDEALKYLSEIYSDLDGFIDLMIEANVRLIKE